MADLMAYSKGKKIYEGKAKIVYAVEDHADLVWLEYKNSLTAFNAEKKGSFEGKGAVNCKITTLIFNHLREHGISTHCVETPDDENMVAKKVDIILLEVVVRNTLAGSTAKKFNIDEGTKLTSPLVEFYYKDDALGDPFISDAQALMLKVASQVEMDQLKEKALEINTVLIPMFAAAGMNLVDFKIEFGRAKDGNILLADEITPDTCRLWDSETGEKMDKDRFRRDLGDVKENYEKVYNRLKEAK